MQKIAIYGKGGIGKSVIATNLSVYYAMHGKRVLHVGCDPKADSSIRLMDNHLPLRTVLEVLGDDPTATTSEKVINVGRHGIECCEAGGPPPGQGCGGRGVAKTLEFLDEMGVFQSGKYDIAIFDVLGDVVCGGFAAPMRQGFAEKIFIVTSEEPMALFAANNICKAVQNYSSNGIVLGGLIANLKDNATNKETLNHFAKLLNTRVMTFISRNELVQEAEKKRKTVVEEFPDSEVAETFNKLAEDIHIFYSSGVEVPTPISEEVFFKFIKEGG